MKKVETIEQLEQLYDSVVPAAREKVWSTVSPMYEKWITASRFLVLATIGEDGTDASPRGDVDSVVQVFDEKTLLLPDWRGNNRLDSLRNIVQDGRVSLMFMVPGSNNVVRVNGNAFLAVDDKLTTRFEQSGKHPRSVVVINVAEVYYQCAKALMRSKLWQRDDESDAVPSAGQFRKELKADFDADAYDAGYGDYAKDRLW